MVFAWCCRKCLFTSPFGFAFAFKLEHNIYMMMTICGFELLPTSFWCCTKSQVKPSSHTSDNTAIVISALRSKIKSRARERDGSVKWKTGKQQEIHYQEKSIKMYSTRNLCNNKRFLHIFFFMSASSFLLFTFFFLTFIILILFVRRSFVFEFEAFAFIQFFKSSCSIIC